MAIVFELHEVEVSKKNLRQPAIHADRQLRLESGSNIHHLPTTPQWKSQSISQAGRNQSSPLLFGIVMGGRGFILSRRPESKGPDT